MSQRSLWLWQVARALDQRFVPHVPKDGIKGGETEKAKTEAERQVRSRALTALAATMLACIPDQDAARRVTDRFADDGIDGFALGEWPGETPVVYLLQAKWSAEGTYNFGTGDVQTLVEGLRKLRTWVDLDPANPIRAFEPEIQPVIDTPGVRFVLAWVTSGQQKVSDGVKKYAAQRIREVVKDGVAVEARFLVLKGLVDELRRGVAPGGVTVTGELLSSRMHDDQGLSLQGSISAVTLGRWYLEHREDLLDENIRVPRKSRVNDEIAESLLRESARFWNLHDGINALCDTWQKSGALAREVAFTFRGLRIVNGAQTAGVLGAALEKAEAAGPAAVAALAEAELQIRFTKLAGEDPGLGARIAYANNRMNPVTFRDMLAMHHVQQRLREEFTLTWGESYLIRADETAPEEREPYSVLEAVLAMACARLDIPALVEAHGAVEALWPGERDLYDLLFSSRISVAEVRRRILALRAITAALHQEGACTTEREKEAAVLGELIIAHIVFRRLGSDGIEDIASDWDGRLASIVGHARMSVRALAARIDAGLASRDAPEPGRGFRRVRGLLENDQWLAEAVEGILADDGPAPGIGTPWPSAPEFRLAVGSAGRAWGYRCDGGFMVSAGSLAGTEDWPSLTTPQRRHRQYLRGTLGLVPAGDYLRLTRDALFESPSQAAAVMIGHSANGADEWIAPDGRSYNQVVEDERRD